MKNGLSLQLLIGLYSWVTGLWNSPGKNMKKLIEQPTNTTDMATKNLIHRVNNLLDDVKNNGFRGIKVANITHESIWHPEYAIFIIEFAPPPRFAFYFQDETDCEYCTPAVFDEDLLKSDFADHVRENFPECDVRVGYHGKEFEIIGRNNKAFYDRYQNQLEEEYSKHDEDQVKVWIPEDYEH